jgi:hypothetical protein
MSARWTPEEDAVLRLGRAKGWSYEVIARHLPGRKPMHCRVRAQRIGLAKSRGDGPRAVPPAPPPPALAPAPDPDDPLPWSRAEDAVLADGLRREARYGRDARYEQIAAQLPGRSACACRLRARRIGLVDVRPRRLSDFNGAAARDLNVEYADVQLGRAMNAAFFEDENCSPSSGMAKPPRSESAELAKPSRSPSQTTHEDTLSGGLGRGRGTAQISALQADPTLALRPGACRWPIGEPGEAGFHYCGAASVSGRSYCAAHLAIAIDRVLSPIHSEAGIPGFRLQNRHKGRAA